MKLVLIHGKPAVGKVTVARLLAQRTGATFGAPHLVAGLVSSVPHEDRAAAHAIAARGVDNKGINEHRRDAEARLFAGGQRVSLA